MIRQFHLTHLGIFDLLWDYFYLQIQYVSSRPIHGVRLCNEYVEFDSNNKSHIKNDDERQSVYLRWIFCTAINVDYFNI